MERPACLAISIPNRNTAITKSACSPRTAAVLNKDSTVSRADIALHVRKVSVLATNVVMSIYSDKVRVTYEPPLI